MGNILFNKCYQGNIIAMWKKINCIHTSHTYLAKINSKWIKDLHVQIKLQHY
jgi:hypothetical protein